MDSRAGSRRAFDRAFFRPFFFLIVAASPAGGKSMAAVSMSARPGNKNGCTPGTLGSRWRIGRGRHKRAILGKLACCVLCRMQFPLAASRRALPGPCPSQFTAESDRQAPLVTGLLINHPAPCALQPAGPGRLLSGRSVRQEGAVLQSLPPLLFLPPPPPTATAYGLHRRPPIPSQQQDMVTAHPPEGAALAGATLLLPVVSVGNVPQLAADLLINTLHLPRAARLDDPALLPAVGHRGYAHVEGLATSMELYGSTGGLAVVQQRAPAAPGTQAAFAQRLAEFVKQSGAKEVSWCWVRLG